MSRNLSEPVKRQCVVCGRTFESKAENAVACGTSGHSVVASAVRKFAHQEAIYPNPVQGGIWLSVWFETCLMKEQARIGMKTVLRPAPDGD